MKSSERGKSASGCEVTNISQHGLWILAEGTEYFLPFEKFPWFKDARVGEITELEFSHGSHLYWPKLDIDLSLDILRDPDKYRLVSK